MANYKSTTNINEQTVLRVTWLDDDGNVIVSGEKLVKGGEQEAKKAEAAFAEDLRRNFSDRFPIPPNPEPDPEGMM